MTDTFASITETVTAIIASAERMAVEAGNPTPAGVRCAALALANGLVRHPEATGTDTDRTMATMTAMAVLAWCDATAEDGDPSTALPDSTEDYVSTHAYCVACGVRMDGTSGVHRLPDCTPVPALPAPVVPTPRKGCLDTPARWDAALARAHANRIQVFRERESGAFYALSSDAERLYAVGYYDCVCPAALAGDPVCLHRALYRELCRRDDAAAVAAIAADAELAIATGACPDCLDSGYRTFFGEVTSCRCHIGRSRPFGGGVATADTDDLDEQLRQPVRILEPDDIDRMLDGSLTRGEWLDRPEIPFDEDDAEDDGDGDGSEPGDLCAGCGIPADRPYVTVDGRHVIVCPACDHPTEAGHDPHPEVIVDARTGAIVARASMSELAPAGRCIGCLDVVDDHSPSTVLCGECWTAQADDVEMAA